MERFVFVCIGTLAFTCSSPANGQIDKPTRPLWKPIVDEVYLQETSILVPTGSPINAVAIHDDRIYIGGQDGVSHLEGESVIRRSDLKGNVAQLKVLNEVLYAAGPDGFWRLNNDGVWNRLSSRPVADMCSHEGRIIVASSVHLFAVEHGKFEPLNSETSSGSRPPLLGVASFSGTLYVHDGKRVGLLERGRVVYRSIADWGRLQRGCTVRDIHAIGSRLYVATDEGLGILRGMTWYQIKGADGLCYEDTTCLASGFDRDIWVGTTRGAIRKTEQEFQYFGHPRWIPHDHVNAVATGKFTTCIATNGGLGIIRYEPFTLAKKAAYYERWLTEWGMKRLGFVHILFREDDQWVREVSDNDVGFSSHYLHAKCFEYGVTGNATVRAEAVDMMKTVKWSEEITSIDGFPARSIYAVGELTHKAMHGSGGLPAEWHTTADGLWEWKGDTSSDEVDAHVYETSLFLNLVANAQERIWAIDHLRRIVGHIVDNGFFLKDVDGKPTRWGRWDPEYLQTPYGAQARGLNGMEAFNYVTTALHFTGEQKFADGKAIHLKQGYLRDILRQKLTFPAGYNTHFDDRLAFYSYFPLIQYETDAELKSLWRRSLERSWEVKRSAGVPWFNFIYGALTGNDCETTRSVEHLRGWPLDLRRHSFTNSHRDDLHMPEGYRMYAEQPKLLNPRETAPNRWDGDYMRLDGGSGGRVVADPGCWLDAYWMGRYYGMITAPQTNDPTLLTVPDRNEQHGAAPYSGPARPKLQHELKK